MTHFQQDASFLGQNYGCGAFYDRGYGLGDGILLESHGEGIFDFLKSGLKTVGSALKTGAKKALELTKKYVIPVAKTAGKNLIKNTVSHVAANLGQHIENARTGGIRGLLSGLKDAIPEVLAGTVVDTISPDEGDEDEQAVTDNTEFEHDLQEATGNGYNHLPKRIRYKQQLLTVCRAAMFSMKSQLSAITRKLTALSKLVSKDRQEQAMAIEEMKLAYTSQLTVADETIQMIQSMLDTMMSAILRLLQRHPDPTELIDPNHEKGGFLTALLSGLLPNLVAPALSTLGNATKDIPVIGPILGGIGKLFGGNYEHALPLDTLRQTFASRLADLNRAHFMSPMSSRDSAGFSRDGLHPLFVPLHMSTGMGVTDDMLPPRSNYRTCTYEDVDMSCYNNNSRKRKANWGKNDTGATKKNKQ